MKSKLSLLTTVGLLAWSMTGHSQNSTAAADSADAQTPTAVAESSSASPAVATDPAAPEQKTPAAVEAPVAAVPAEAAATPSVAPEAAPAAVAPVATTESAPATTPIVAANDAKPATDAAPAAEPSAVVVTNAPAVDNSAVVVTNAAAADTSAVTTTNAAIIPLIVMDDVPLTDAIKNLARQAGLNYMLDPKIGFTQPGPNGQAAAQPSVSIRWENITAEQALNALLNNYSLQMQEDPKTKIARITVKDPAAPDPLVTRIIQLKYANPSNIVASVQNALVDKRSKVVADIRTSQLVILATDRELNDIDNLVVRLDTVTRQVLIEAKLLETSMSPSTSKGLDWSGTLQAQHLAFGNNLQQNSPSAALNNTLSQSLPRMLFDTAKGFNPGTAFLDADGVAAVFSFINKDSEAKVLSAPRTVTLDNEPARIEVTRASPIINITPGTVQVSGGSQITYTNLGIILNVTPRISANNYVNLKVTPEVSRIFDTITRSVGPNGVFQADEYDVRKIDTRVMIPSGNTLVLGGLVQDDVRKATTKVPLLGDIPFLGKAFQSDTKSRQKSNLIIFITPTIVQEEDYQKTSTDFLKSPVPMSDSVDGPWSSWDSGKPKDWSKRKATSEPTVSNGADFTPIASAN